MKRLIIIAAVSAVILAGFCGCGKKEEKAVEVTRAPLTGTVTDFFSDVSAVSGFKCICTDTNGKKIVKTENKAKGIYKYLKEQMEDSEETDFDSKENDSIRLVFQKGSVDAEQDMTSVDELNRIQYYGVFTVYDDDTLSVSGSPDASVGLCYTVPDGTYKKLTEKLNRTED